MQQTNQEIRNQLLEVFSNSVLEDGWNKVSCASIAQSAGLEVKEAFIEFPNRYSYVTELIRRIDREMLGEYDSSMQEEPARDRLFDVLMGRFDAMRSYRPLIKALTASTKTDPMLSLHLMALSRLSMDWVLEMAHIRSTGVMGQMRLKGAMAAYARAFYVWLDDDNEDMAKTMAELDKVLKRGEKALRKGEKALRRAERLACCLPIFSRKSSRKDRKAKSDDDAIDSPNPGASVDGQTADAAAT